jgi:hypothetical protein
VASNRVDEHPGPERHEGQADKKGKVHDRLEDSFGARFG